MAYSDDDDPSSQRDSDVEPRDDEEEEEEEERDAAAEDTSQQQEDEDEDREQPNTEPEIEESFDDEEEVLVPKAFPRTIQLVLPDSSSPTPANATKAPTTVHVCLTRGSIGRVTARPSTRQSTSGGDVGEEGWTTQELGTTAARIQGCCAETHRFDGDYGPRLSELRRRHILRQLQGQPERQQRFLRAEKKAAATQPVAGKADEDEENQDEDEEREVGGAAAPMSGEPTDPLADPLAGVVWSWTATQHPPPYWLPSLLANDTQTFQRVLEVMYGWIIAPEAHPCDRLRLNSAGQLVSGPQKGADGAGDEDDEDLEQADPAHHKPDFFLRSNAFGGAEEDDEEGERERESSVRTDRGGNGPSSQRASKSLLNDFNNCERDADASDRALADHEPSAGGDAQAQQLAKLSTATAPPPVVALPAFPFTQYEFFIAQDTESGEWHLLDTHPLYVMEACRRRRAEQRGARGQSPLQDGQQQAGTRDEDDEDDDDDNKGGEDDEGDLENKQGSGGAGAVGQLEESAEESAGDLCPLPRYNISTILPVSPVVLAALFSASALRCCLLQPLKSANTNADDVDDEDGADSATLPHSPSSSRHQLLDTEVLRSFDTAWLAADVVVALPILATICRARQRVVQHDTMRIPYRIGPLPIDLRPLFTVTALTDANSIARPPDVRQWCVNPGEEFAEAEPEVVRSRPQTAMAVATVLPHRWGPALDHVLPAEQYGRVVLSALLAAHIHPTRALPLALFTHLGALRLALWWWLRLPSSLLSAWSIDGGAAQESEEAAAMDGNGAEEGEEEAEEGEEEEAAGLDGVPAEEATALLAQRIGALPRLPQRHLPGPALRFSPLLRRVLLELQRRLDRLSGVDGRGSPLPPSQYSLQESVAQTFAMERLDSGRPRQDPLVTAAFTGVSLGLAVRHHRLYQSDIVLLALALTSTPAPIAAGPGRGPAVSRRPAAVENDDEAFATDDATTAVPPDSSADGALLGAAAEDGHTALFRRIFEAKLMRCVRSPLERTRAGTTKLLLLCAADFCLSATRHCLFSHLPSFELFGNNGYCPLPVLVQAWADAATRSTPVAAAQLQRTVDDFAFYTWNELRWRLRTGQYSAEAIAEMTGQLPELLARVDAHTNTYYSILAQLQQEADVGENMGVAHASSSPQPNVSNNKSHTPQRLSLVRGATRVAAAAAAAATRQSPTGTVARRVPLTLASPNIYSAEVLAAKARVLQQWAALPASPQTYLTPETLFRLLFATAEEAAHHGPGAAAPLHAEPRFNTAALRVLLESGVSTVQPCPLDSLEEPAVEAALRRGDGPAVMVLLGLGAASLHDLRTDGTATLEAWAESVFAPEDVEVLQYIEAQNAKAARSDPRVQFGARRFEATTV